MTDVWAMVGELDMPTQDRLADVLEMRDADPRQQAMREAFLAEIRFPAKADVLEVGCGTGVLTRSLGRMVQDGAVVGVDLAASLLDKAGELAADAPNVRFRHADARSLPFADETFDIVVFDSTLSHVPPPEQAVIEAARASRRRLDGSVRR